MSGMMTGVRLDGMKVGINLTTIPQAHVPLGSFDLGAMRSPKRVGMGENGLWTQESHFH